MNTPAGNPFRTVAPDADVTDDMFNPVEPWEELRFAPWDDHIKEAGDALLRERNRLRDLVITLEAEAHALRGLVERARNRIYPDDPEHVLWADWLADADRILAPATDEDE